MQEEKLNNSWKQKLEDANNLQHALLQNRDAAWEKLYHQLDKKPQRKIIMLYWFAAACVLLIMMISLLTFYASTKNSAQLTTAIIDSKKLISPENKIKKVNESKEIIALVKRPVQKGFAVANHIKTTAPDTILKQIEKSDINFSQITNMKTLPDDTLLTASAQQITTNKKLKVVHVNELGEPVEFPSDFAHSSDLHLFQLKLAQQEIYNVSSTASNSNSALFFKPKNSPN